MHVAKQTKFLHYRNRFTTLIQNSYSTGTGLLLRNRFTTLIMAKVLMQRSPDSPESTSTLLMDPDMLIASSKNH